MVQMIERVEGRYEVREVPFGKVYAWCPGHVVIECDCGKRMTLTGSATICECGTDHAATIRGELTAGRSKDEELHPWRYARGHEGAGIPF